MSENDIFRCAVIGREVRPERGGFVRERLSALVGSLAAEHDRIEFCTAALGPLQQALYTVLLEARPRYPEKELLLAYYGTDRWLTLTSFHPVYRIEFNHIQIRPEYNRKRPFRVSEAVRELAGSAAAAVYYPEPAFAWNQTHCQIRYFRRLSRQGGLTLWSLSETNFALVQKKFTSALKR